MYVTTPAADQEDSDDYDDGPPQDDPLSRFGLDAIDIRWTLRDIIAKRWTLSPVNPGHLAKLIDLGLVEMREEKPYATIRGQDVAWLPY